MATEVSLIDSRFFCIIGAQRSGSTWLAEMLDAHPEITMAKPLRPEPKYFIRKDYDPRMDGAGYRRALYGSDDCSGFYGEKGTSYIEFPETADRIQRVFPQARILVILRNPIDRALSNYRFSVENGMEPRSLSQVFLEESQTPEQRGPTSVSPFNYIGRGEYIRYLEPWKEKFGDKMKVLILEELENDPDQLHALYGWIGVERSFLPSRFYNRVNSSRKPVVSKMTDQVRNKLHAHFAPYTKRLELWLGRPFPSWT